MYSYKILQNSTRDLFHSSILTFDSKIYLFNCSDGTQRNLLEQDVKFHKICNIFYNSSSIDAYSGSYGFIMSRHEQVFSQLIAHNDSHKQVTESKASTSKKNSIPINPDKNIYLWGAKGLVKNFNNCGYFFIDKIKENIYEYDFSSKLYIRNHLDSSLHFEDENINIYSIAIQTPFHTVNQDLDTAMSYICIPKQKRPGFLIEKAKALGLKPGPLFSKLQNGEEVFFEGKTIRPEEVLGVSSPSSSLAILYSPTISHSYLLTQDHFINNLNSADYCKTKHELTIIVHILGDHRILDQEFYQKFILSFGSSVKHIIDCKETNTKYMLNLGKHKIKFLLNLHSPHFFSINNFTQEDCEPLVNKSYIYNQLIDLNIDIIPSFSGFEYLLYPIGKKGILKNEIYSPYLYKDTQFNYFIEESTKIYQMLSENQEEAKIEVKEIYNNEPEITFLGTISMKPGIFRNVSSIMIRLHKNNDYIILFDCGEATFQQIYDHYGNNTVDRFLNKIKVIYITHKHGDHMLGIMKLLYEIDLIKIKTNQDKDKPKNDEIVFIVAPSTIYKWIENSIHQNLIFASHYILIDCSEINPLQKSIYQKYICNQNPYKDFIDVERVAPEEIENDIYKMKEAMNFQKNQKLLFFYTFLNEFLGVDIYSIEVFHCDESYGCFLESVDRSWKISYSGDTRPCMNFLNFSYNSTLLIHEATFDNDLMKDAMCKMHSTINEGISIGLENNSKNIALTHFSPRYNKISPWNEELEKQEILLSHDFLSFKLSEFKEVQKYLKTFKVLIEVLETKNLI